jgi:hypothetical protein
MHSLWDGCDLKCYFKQVMSEHRPINQHQSILTF